GAKEFAYCPYSRFRMGAALLAHDGTVFTGDQWYFYLSKPDGSYVEMNIEDLLPVSFGPEDLKKNRLFTTKNGS
ncbi:unnamed protein product, partial [Coregonus sp. 'balchen']